MFRCIRYQVCVKTWVGWMRGALSFGFLNRACRSWLHAWQRLEGAVRRLSNLCMQIRLHSLALPFSARPHHSVHRPSEAPQGAVAAAAGWPCICSLSHAACTQVAEHQAACTPFWCRHTRPNASCTPQKHRTAWLDHGGAHLLHGSHHGSCLLGLAEAWGQACQGLERRAPHSRRRGAQAQLVRPACPSSWCE